MTQIVITLDSPEIIDLEKSGDKEAAAKVLVLYLCVCFLKYTF